VVKLNTFEGEGGVMLSIIPGPNAAAHTSRKDGPPRTSACELGGSLPQGRRPGFEFRAGRAFGREENPCPKLPRLSRTR